MDIKTNGPLKLKSRDFAIRIINLYKYIKVEKKEFTITSQVLRSGTSIGANIAESECAISKKDFLSKIYVAQKECNETLYWLDLLHETKYIDENMYDSLLSDCKELIAILVTIIKKLKETPKGSK